MHNQLLFTFFCVAACWTAAQAQQKNTPLEAIVLLEGTGIRGNATFTQNTCGDNVHVHIYITGVPPGLHGMHVHEKGNIVASCMSTGAHFNPDKVDHGGPTNEVRHVGDLGNVEANAQGIVDTTFTDSVISLTGKNSIVGRGLVLHENIDDLGLGEHPDSKKTGNAGGRIACGVIGLNQENSLETSTTPTSPTFYVPQKSLSHDQLIYPLLSSNFPYPYAYPYYI